MFNSQRKERENKLKSQNGYSAQSAAAAGVGLGGKPESDKLLITISFSTNKP